MYNPFLHHLNQPLPSCSINLHSYTPVPAPPSPMSKVLIGNQSWHQSCPGSDSFVPLQCFQLWEQHSAHLPTPPPKHLGKVVVKTSDIENVKAIATVCCNRLGLKLCNPKLSPNQLCDMLWVWEKLPFDTKYQTHEKNYCAKSLECFFQVIQKIYCI